MDKYNENTDNFPHMDELLVQNIFIEDYPIPTEL
jgi:hypothetical protein